ncbi:class I SAM-dependent methyltransferase [Thermoactinospora rubra]|uniref:class I SAM-dependent methyltransferase n=1 Tax=Thermoactinospora rubra TaxID=1088767 RepID=UPI00197E81C7|nr:class I SAM-dependent methyltransferase [Thermoactinospora rubra]
MTYRPVHADPPADLVSRLTLVPFLPTGRVVAPATGASLPTGDVAPGEHWLLDSALLIPLRTHGFRIQRVHSVAVSESEGGLHLYAFAEGAPYRGSRPHAKVELAEMEAEELAAALSGEQARAVLDAAEAYRTQSEESYHADNARHLEAAYLRETTPWGQSGKGGTQEDWRAGRAHLAEAIDRDGAFLDVGCANGYLAECIRDWAAERGHAVEPYGVDIAPGLIELARRRLPHWADRFWVGNALTFVPPRRFTFVHVLLDCAPRDHRADLVRHALTSMVEAGGRLLVSEYGTLPGESAAERLHAMGLRVDGVTSGGTAWITDSA